MSNGNYTRDEIETGRKLFAADWDFVAAASSDVSLPPMRGLEIAFAGRSNVGKSSLVNAMTGRFLSGAGRSFLHWAKRGAQALGLLAVAGAK